MATATTPVTAAAPAPPPIGHRPGRWLTAEGSLWLAVLVLLAAASIAKNINLLALLTCILFAVLLPTAAGCGSTCAAPTPAATGRSGAAGATRSPRPTSTG